MAEKTNDKDVKETKAKSTKTSADTTAKASKTTTAKAATKSTKASADATKFTKTSTSAKKAKKTENTKTKNFLKVVLSILLILIAFVIANGFRNYFTFSDLQDRVKPYVTSTNYHIHSVNVQKDNSAKVSIDYYRRNSRYVLSVTREVNGEKTTITAYQNGSRCDIFTEAKDSKTVKLNQDPSSFIMQVNVLDPFGDSSKFKVFMYGIFAHLHEEDYNGMRVCKITNLYGSDTLSSNGLTYYIDKATGLVVKTEDNYSEVEKTYDFDSVDDKIFLEPDISEYQISK